MRNYELSHPQKRIFYQDLYMSDKRYANLIGATFFKVEPNPLLLEKVLNLVIKNNDALRIKINQKHSIVSQVITKYHYHEFDIISSDYHIAIEKLCQSGFLLFCNELFYFAIINTDEQFGFFYKYHHIIIDAMSVSLINKQVNSLYNQLLNVEKLNFNNQSYQQFFKREKLYLSEYSSIDELFWKDQFKETLNLDYFPCIINPDFKTERKVLTFSDELTELINQFCSKHHASLFRLFIAVFYVYFYKITQIETIVITTGHHNRLSDEDKALVGMTVSTVPIKMKIDAKSSFLDFLLETKKQVKNCLTHQQYPFDELADYLRDKGIDPIKISQISLNHIPSLTEDYEVKRYCPGVDSDILNIKINPNQLPNDDLIELAIDYRTQLFTDFDIELLFQRLLLLIKTVISNPQIKIQDIDILTEREKTLILNLGEARDFNLNTSVVKLFKEQVIKDPDKVAAICGDNKISFQELDVKSDRLAKNLISLGITSEVVVGICTNRSIDFIVGIIAIFKAKGAYLPIDKELPLERISYLINDSNALVILTQKSINLEFNRPVLYIDCDTEVLNHEIDYNNKSSDLAYIIYTSGSTGNPKGVMIEQEQLLNFTKWYQEEYQLKSSDKVACFNSFSFDVSISEIIPPLLSGASIYIITEDLRKDPDILNAYFLKHHITIATLPTRFGEFYISSTKNKYLRYLFIVGEKFNNFHKQDYQIINAYGPTETTIYATTFKVNKDYPNIPIGKPISNANCIVLLDNGNLAPIGVIGELAISGRLVSRGYINLEEKTNDKFITDSNNPQLRLYKTGDLVRLNGKLLLEYIGRKDEQVKINGYRVELGEIESALKQNPFINEAAVIEINSILYAFYSTKNNYSEINNSDINQLLINKLPSYMIPAQVIKLEKIPLLDSGKVNKKSLSDFIASNKNSINDESLNQVEHELLSIWEGLLNTKVIKKDTSFFEIGGHSLLALRLFKKINDYFKTNIPVSYIYTSDTIEKQALLIKQKRLNRLIKIRDGNSDKIIFCIHDLLGEILSYRNIAEHMDYEIYGIRYDYPLDEEITIESIARDYIDEIKRIKPHGPYYLLGYSSGGLIAFEMARILKSRNEELGLVILIDSPNYQVYPYKIKSFYPIIFKYGISWFIQLSLQAKSEFIKYVYRVFIPNCLKSLFKKTQYKVFTSQKKIKETISKYKTGEYREELVLLSSVESSKFHHNLGWNNEPKLRVIPIKGNHITVLNKKNSRNIANILDNLLGRD